MTADETNDEIETGETRLTVEPDEQTIEITRVFDAPRERVLDAWIEPDAVREWLPRVRGRLQARERERLGRDVRRVGRYPGGRSKTDGADGDRTDAMLAETVAVVDGAGGQIGGAVTRAFARKRAKVFLAGRTEATLADVGDVAAFVASDRARTMSATAVNVSCGALMDRRGGPAR